jgi:hypothetical protein
MNLLTDLQQWKEGKSKIFAAKQFVVSITPVLGDTKKARYVEIDGNGLLARATLWEDGSLELEALDKNSDRTVTQASRLALTSAELRDSLNWWLSEIAIYAPPET